jgi:hypothetical protein
VGAKSQRHAKSLFSNRDIGAELARRFQQCQRKNVRRDHDSALRRARG